MVIKRLALSVFVIAASGAYVWHQATSKPRDDLLGAALPSGADALPPVQRQVSGAAPRPTIQVPSTVIDDTAASQPVPVALPPQPQTAADPPVMQSPPPPAVQPVTVEVPLPRLRPRRQLTQLRATLAASVVPTSGAYADGTYTGPETDAYYGLIRIQAIVQGGRLVAIKVLEYPSDRRTSVAINRQALPMLRDEVIAAQSARVDTISGATLTSEAFMQSLDGALGQATSTL